MGDCPASSESDTTCALGPSCAGKRRSLHSVSENHSEVHRTYHNLLNLLACVFTIVILETSVCKLYFAKLSWLHTLRLVSASRKLCEIYYQWRTYLFNWLIHDVPDNCHSPSLAKSQNASDCLTLYRRVPLWFYNVDAVSNREVVKPDFKTVSPPLSPRFLTRLLIPYSPSSEGY